MWLLAVVERQVEASVCRRHENEIRLMLVTMLGFTATTCQRSDQTGQASLVDRAYRGDTLLVRSRAPLYADTASLREVLRIGTAEGNEQNMLDDVSAFVEMADGRVIVADGAGLRAFSGEGLFLERIARPGQGPGEVQYVVGMAAAPDGSLLAVDLGNRRINVYRVTGELDHWPLPPGMAGYGRASIVATDDGAAYVAYNPPPPSDGNPLPYPRPIFLKLGPTGTAIDTVHAETRFLEGCPTRSASQWRSGFYEDLREPYFPKVKWALGPTGTLAVGCPVSYELDLIRSDGSVVRISREWVPVIVSEEERKSFVEVQAFSRNSSGYFERWSWEGPQPPGQRPAYDRILFGREGRIWIWPAQPSARQDVPKEYTQMGAPAVVYQISSAGSFDVFNETGEYLGAVRLPDDLPYNPFPGRADPFIRGDTLWALRYDSLDVPYLTKYAVQWPARKSTNASGT